MVFAIVPRGSPSEGVPYDKAVHDAPASRNQRYFVWVGRDHERHERGRPDVVHENIRVTDLRRERGVTARGAAATYRSRVIP